MPLVQERHLDLLAELLQKSKRMGFCNDQCATKMQCVAESVRKIYMRNEKKRRSWIFVMVAVLLSNAIVFCF